jgi:hypothetical protein
MFDEFVLDINKPTWRYKNANMITKTRIYNKNGTAPVFLSCRSSYCLSKHIFGLGFINGKYIWKYFNYLDQK